MPTDAITLVGAGGHMLVVLDALLSGPGPAPEVRIVDQNPNVLGSIMMGHEVRAFTLAEMRGARFHVSIGDATARRDVFAALLEAGGEPVTVIHPRATVSSSASVGTGSFVAAGAVVGPLAALGRGVIVNHNAVVDHECGVGDFCHVAPGASLAGRVQVGELTLIGAGARVLPGGRIGQQAIVGAGAIVTKDVGDGITVVGAPARPLT